MKKGTVVLTAVLLVVTLGCLFHQHQRSQRYAQALRLAESGDASGAYGLFVGLGDYADAR